MTSATDRAAAFMFAANNPSEWGLLVDQISSPTAPLFHRIPDLVACSLFIPVYGKVTIDSQLLSPCCSSPSPTTEPGIPLCFSPPYPNADRAIAPNPPKEIS